MLLLLLLLFPVHILHMSHQCVPSGESVLTPLVLTIILFVVYLTVKQDILYPGIGEVAQAADDLAPLALQSRVDDVVGVERLAVC